jgi:hypothetical protein
MGVGVCMSVSKNYFGSINANVIVQAGNDGKLGHGTVEAFDLCPFSREKKRFSRDYRSLALFFDPPASCHSKYKGRRGIFIFSLSIYIYIYILCMFTR